MKHKSSSSSPSFLSAPLLLVACIQGLAGCVEPLAAPLDEETGSGTTNMQPSGGNNTSTGPAAMDPSIGSTSHAPSDMTESGTATTADAAESSTTAPPADSTSTTDDATAGTMSDEQLCAANCAIETMCWLAPGEVYPLDQCLEDCRQNLHAFDGVEDGEECNEAFRNLVECVGSLSSCDEAETCDAHGEAVMECDNAFSCGFGISTDGQASCDVTFTCDSPTSRSIACADTDCTCIVDGAQAGTCPAMNLCEDVFHDPDVVGEFAETCCGWSLAGLTN